VHPGGIKRGPAKLQKQSNAATWTHLTAGVTIFYPPMLYTKAIFSTDSATLRAVRARTILALAALSLVPACSAGSAARDDDGGPAEFNSPYVPSTQNPNTQNPPTNTENPNTQNPPTNTENPNTQNPPTNSNETPDDNLPLEPGETLLGSATMGGSGSTQERYHKTDVTRDGQNYFLMANGWGPNFDSQSLSWNGTSFTVNSLQGEQGPMYEPASYPTVFCGEYSDSRSRECGLPAALDSMTSLRTGWSWKANGNNGEYNAAYDIWLGTSEARSSFSGYLMVWYREPAGQQPAGSPTSHRGISVTNVPGTWDIWTGQVGGRPIINWVRAEGQDTPSMEFDILDFVRDAESRGLTVPGSHVLSVAVGFEIWNGPITNLISEDFYVNVE
jgi:hypothetical protein